MDKVFSARIDEQTISQIETLARALGTSKKGVLEQAVRALAESLANEPNVDILASTAGAWKRNESSSTTARKAKTAFRDSFERHRRDK